MTRPIPAALALSFLVVAFLGISACTYSKSYFRIGPDGKMLKADGPVTPEELAGDTVPEGDEDVEVTGGDAPNATTGSEEDIRAGETSGGDGSGMNEGSTTGKTTGGFSIPTMPRSNL